MASITADPLPASGPTRERTTNADPAPVVPARRLNASVSACARSSQISQYPVTPASQTKTSAARPVNQRELRGPENLEATKIRQAWTTVVSTMPAEAKRWIDRATRWIGWSSMPDTAWYEASKPYW